LATSCRIGRVPDDELVVLTELPPLAVDPRYNVGAYDYKISRLIFEPLVSGDTETLEPKMELAESVVSVGNDWVVTLREARFSDGKAVTTDDILYTFEVLRDPHTGGAAARLRQGFLEAGLTGFDVRDHRHMTIHLSHPFAPFITDLDFGIMERPPAGRPAGPEPLGAGPFMLAARDGEIWKLKPNPYYHGGAPPARALTFKTIRDDNSRLLALVGGSGDLTQNTISPLLIDAVAAQPRLRVAHAASSVYTYLGINCDDPILKDVRVRRALAYAIDRRTIIHTKLHDYAVPATGMLPKFHWAYEPDVEPYEYDPEKAKQLLDEAGYRDPDGDGPLPRFTLTYKTSSVRVRVAIAMVIADMLRKVGIGVEVRPYEFATLFADVKKGNFQIFTMQIPEISEPNLYVNFFASWRIPTRENLDAGGNRVRYRSPEVDRLIVAGQRELVREKRKRIYGDIQKALARDVPVISLWHEDIVAAMRKEVRGFSILPTAQFGSLAKTYKEPKR
jgi:peptide/nickel transport system substrate-binding protein